MVADARRRHDEELLQYLEPGDIDLDTLIEERPDGGTRVAYDSVVSALARYGNAAASAVADRLDTEVLTLLREATGVMSR